MATGNGNIQFPIVSQTLIPVPVSGNTNIFYDLDGILKQKDASGFVSNIGVASGYTGTTQYWTPSTGTESLVIIGQNCIASGNYSVAVGYATTASTLASFAEGSGTSVTGNYSHAEGKQTIAAGDSCHAEGYMTQALGQGAHSEGYQSQAIENGSHAEGHLTVCNVGADNSHSEGESSACYGIASHAEGSGTANGTQCHAEGTNTFAIGIGAHAEGYKTYAIGDGSHSEGWETSGTSNYSHAEGRQSVATGTYCHSEGYLTNASGIYSHTEGISSIGSGIASHAEGSGTTATATASHAEGIGAVTYMPAEYAMGSGIFNNAGDSQYTMFSLSKIVRDTAIGIKTNLGTYPIASGKIIYFGLPYGQSIGWGLTGVIANDFLFGGIGAIMLPVYYNDAGTITRWDGGTSVNDLAFTLNDNGAGFQIQVYAQDIGSGNLEFYAMLYNTNTSAYDITGSVNLTLAITTIVTATY